MTTTKTDDQIRFEKVRDELNGKAPLERSDYYSFLSAIKDKRASIKDKRASIDEEEATEAASWTFQDLDAIGGIDELSHAANTLDNILSKLGPVGHIIGNGIGLLLTPWRCYKEKRLPTRHDALKLALSASALVLIVMSLALPAIATGFIITAGVIGLMRSIQKTQIEKNELHHLKEGALKKQVEIEELMKDIDTLNKTKRNPSQDKELNDKISQLSTKTDEYVLDGYHINERQHSTSTLPGDINIAMSAVALIGLIVTPFFPPAGLAILLGAGIISVGTFGISSVAKWYTQRHDKHPANPAPLTPEATTATDTAPSQSQPQDTAAMGLSSTAKELQELTLHTASTPEPKPVTTIPPEPTANTEAETSATDIKLDLKSEIKEIKPQPNTDGDTGKIEGTTCMPGESK